MSASFLVRFLQNSTVWQTAIVFAEIDLILSYTCTIFVQDSKVEMGNAYITINLKLITIFFEENEYLVNLEREHELWLIFEENKDLIHSETTIVAN